MREIKFRAWILGKMWEVRALDWNEDGIFITTDGGFMHLCEEDDVDLMQHTGLVDKNGKEIYEGDILAFDDPLYKHLKRWKVIYKDASFVLKHIHEFAYASLNSAPYYGEVVGNIYENPELLERELR